ncbi:MULTISPECIES: hypothetical protein [Photorhabdus]|uniref:Uncharacterized protein n=2 Tax=Photorhabdus TaxID=29487 RepID=A0ABX0AUI2_9GAMM|nr:MULTISPECIES: hypothetical protein [Photorhabdus]MCC8374192.1 hypothetical protein [Photorhabdus bodei]MCC8465045.1 hypothetical protein [Photorhabdus bodei]MCT8353218.1 hypothetical protein [Photorhabdus kayaii]MDB6369603.1 hypothetical protein [Photorhabdus bodei]MDB6371692.1 hypothetical protein [Photorhabdus bodei]
MTNFRYYTLRISRCIATARERIPGSIANYVTGVSECSQQRGNLKDNGYILLTTDPGRLYATSSRP